MPGVPYALAASDATEFFANLVTGAKDGDPLSLLVVGIAVLIVLRFTAVRWVWLLAKQTFIFGGLAYAVHLVSGSALVVEGLGEGAARALRYAGFVVVGGLYLVMVYMFFLRRAHEKDAAGKKAHRDARRVTLHGPTTTRVGAGPLQGQGLAVTQKTQEVEVETKRPTGDAEPSRLEDVLRKINVLSANRDQNLMTVMLLILVAEFGVFSSFTIAAPSATVGMALFGALVVGAVVFVKTSYQDYWKGVRHFAFATVFAMALSVIMLVYWQGTYCDTSAAVANATASSDCAGDPDAALSWAVALDPQFYFRSDGLIAAITGVAFSTLLTKGGAA